MILPFHLEYDNCDTSSAQWWNVLDSTDIQICRCYELDTAHAIMRALESRATADEPMIAALKQADDTLSWAQHFLKHANKQAIPDTLAQIRAAIPAS